ncbi:hypothetical protein Tco_1243382 [Tanacetum coccineum]
MIPVWQTYESDVERLREVVITLHKTPPNLLYTASLSHSWKYAGHVSELKGPDGKGSSWQPLAGWYCAVNPYYPSSGEKRKKAEAKAAAKANTSGNVEKAVGKKRSDEEGTSQKKNRKTRQEPPTSPLTWILSIFLLYTFKSFQALGGS